MFIIYTILAKDSANSVRMNSGIQCSHILITLGTGYRTYTLLQHKLRILGNASQHKSQVLSCHIT